AEPIVERATGEPPLAQHDGLGDDQADVAGADEAPRLVRGACADIHVQVLDVGGLALGDGGRLATACDHALDAGEELDTLADERLGEIAADTADGDVALVVDVRR